VNLGYRYDSSALPSPPYYAAKLMVMAWMAVRGRRSRSTARGWRSFLGARRPRYINDFGLWEIPMSVSRYLRLPLIRTMLLAGPEHLATILPPAAPNKPSFHLHIPCLSL